MPVLAICPYCSKTIKIERIPRVSCTDCGTEFGFAELQRKHLLVDSRTEAAELVTAKEFFTNGEFISASEHYKRALAANKNSYTAQYFVLLCDIYMHEADNGITGDNEYDAMTAIVNMVKQSLIVLSHANITVADKLTFIHAMLAETKVIITRRLTSRSDLFDNDIEKYRKVSIDDLTKLLDLFKIDRELIMSFSPEVSITLTEIVDCAIKTCYKAVQTVAVGEDIISPNDDDYRRISALCNELCFFGNSFSLDFNGSSYSPDFSQNYMLNEKVLSRFAKFDDADKLNAKKLLVGDIAEYNSILEECVKALKFTYLNCYRSLCSRQVAQHAQLFYNGFDLLYRLLMPRVVPVDKKQYEVHVPKFADIADWCDILTRFLVDAYELDEVVGKSLHEFYERLLQIVTEYVIPEMEKFSKFKTEADRLAFQKAVFNCACCCAPALHKYVDFSAEADKTRNKLVKICKGATEGFLLHSGLSINEIEQSNFFRPILQISTAVMDEYNE